MQPSAVSTCLRRLLAAGAAASIALVAAPSALAQSFPDKPITIVSPFPPGGAADALARVIGEQLGSTLGQSVVVENRVGASTVIGASHVARARPDGYTLLLATNTTLVANRFLFQDLAYDPDAYAPVGMLGVVPMVMLGSKKSPFQDFPGLIAHAKAHPGELTVASVGIGTTSHLALEQLQQMAGIEAAHVPFNGAAQIFPALVNGDVDAFFDTLSTGMPQVQGGQMRALALTSGSRAAAYPEVPSIAEMGYPEFDMNIWFSLVAPPQTSPDAMAVLQAALQKAMAGDTLRQRIANLGIQPTDATPEAMTAQIGKEVPVFEQLVRQAGIERK